MNLRLSVIVPLLTVFALFPIHSLGQDKLAIPGGELQILGPDGKIAGACPLKQTDVIADIAGFVGRVTVRQTFHNPTDSKIEAVYVFPLPQDAAVDDMVMTVGDRRIVGRIKPRDEAREIYEAAKSAGHVASLLDQERPNIFTQSVANIEPGVEVVIEISYVETLKYDEGVFEWVFPMVVGPRYIPGVPSGASMTLPKGLTRATHQVIEWSKVQSLEAGPAMYWEALTESQLRALLRGAVPIDNPLHSWSVAHWQSFTFRFADGTEEVGQVYGGGVGEIAGRHFYFGPGFAKRQGEHASAPSPMTKGHDTPQVPDGSKITPPVAPKGTRAGHDISLTVNIDAGMELHDIKSVLHNVEVATLSAERAVVTLADQVTIPNKDFVCHFRLAADSIGDAFLTHSDPRGSFFTLVLQPPKRVIPEQLMPRELIFVLDTSGSMRGFPIEKAKETMSKLIDTMHEGDTFNIITFAGNTHILWNSPRPSTPANREEAQQFLASRRGGGGTEMMKAIDAALVQTRGPASDSDITPIRVVCFMTDGYVGNDMAIIDAVKKNADTTRVFSFGVGNSVNRFLLNGMAHAGRGEVEYVSLASQADAAVERFHERILAPVLTGIEIDWGDLPVADVYPQLIPDLFAAKPIMIHGRLTGPANGAILLSGDTGAGRFEREIAVSTESQGESTAEALGHPALASLWARAAVTELMNRDLDALQSGSFPEPLKNQITNLGVEFRIMTQFTSFVAVEEMTVTAGGEAVRIDVPVEMPDGVSHEGVFGAGRAGFMAGRKTSLRARFRAGPARTIARMPLKPRPAPAAGPVGEGGAIGAPAREEAKDDGEALGRVGDKPDPVNKLSGPLKELAVKVEKEGRDGNLTVGKLRVIDHKLDVMIYLSDLSEKTLEALKDLGFVQTGESKTVRLLIGTIDVRQLDELVKLEAVLRVRPVVAP